MAASALAAIFIQVFTGRVMDFQFHWISVSPAAIDTSEVIIGFNWKYDIPLAIGFVIGAACCLWPARKAPKPPRHWMDRPSNKTP